MPTTYRLTRDGDGDIVPCGVCGCEVPTVMTDAVVPGAPLGEARMCEVCYTTHLSCIMMYPHHADIKPLALAIAQVANLIIAKVKGHEYHSPEPETEGDQ